MKKIRSVALLVILALLGSVCCIHAGTQSTPTLFTLHTSKTAEDIKKLAKECTLTQGEIARNGIVGIAVAGITPVDHPGIISALKELNVSWVRLEIIWSEIERADGSYDWSKPDAIIDGVIKNRMNVLATIVYLPPWLKDWNAAEERFQKFTQAASDRYKPDGVLAKQKGWGPQGVRYWEIFNEPNLPGFGWGAKNTVAADYVREYAVMLVAANRGLRRADPKAVIILAGFSPDGFKPDQYLDLLYKLELKNCFDVVAYHPYGGIGHLGEVQDYMEKFVEDRGDKGKTIWFTELGTNDDAARAKHLRLLDGERKKFNAVMWFSLQDLGRAPGKTYGLMKLDFSKKPDFALFKELFGRPTKPNRVDK